MYYLEDVVEFADEGGRFFLILHSKKRIYFMITILYLHLEGIRQNGLSQLQSPTKSNRPHPQPTPKISKNISPIKEKKLLITNRTCKNLRLIDDSSYNYIRSMNKF
jgi:hypothetical protein